MTKILIVKGDITKIKADAIVNAANSSLLGGGGVDGAIHQAAGPRLVEECKSLGGCKPGEVKITKGYNLLAKYVIHTVGPVWRNGKANEKELLRNCYVNSLKLAEENSIKTVAFPAISTGVYGYPLDQATKLALSAAKEYLENSKLEKVIFVFHGDSDYQQALKIFKGI